MKNSTDLKEVALLFLKLGFTAFGGPAAHTAMMQREVVEKRRWMDHEKFLDLMGATNLIPGPNSTELAIHLGHVRAGWKGLLVAGFCFISPAVLMVLTLAYLYKKYGTLPQIEPFIYGIQPAVIAVIVAAVYPLAEKSIKNRTLLIVGIVVFILAVLGVKELYLLFGSGLLMMGMHLLGHRSGTRAFLPILLSTKPSLAWLDPSLLQLFWIFLKIGSVLYGSGYVLFAFLEQELVQRGLLTSKQLLDSIAVGQFTPGPVFTTVTFVGYLMEGWNGALVSTVAIFLPAFVFVALLGPLMRLLRSSKIFSTFLDAVNVASVALIAAVCVSMSLQTLSDWRTVAIALSAFAVLWRFKTLNSAWVIIGGSLVGLLLSYTG